MCKVQAAGNNGHSDDNSIACRHPSHSFAGVIRIEVPFDRPVYKIFWLLHLIDSFYTVKEFNIKKNVLFCTLQY